MTNLRDADHQMKMQHPTGESAFIGCERGHLYQYSLKEKTVLHKARIFDSDINSLACTNDNKKLFACNEIGHFREYNAATHTIEKNFAVISAVHCLVTFNNKLLVTAEYGNNKTLSFWSIDAQN